MNKSVLNKYLWFAFFAIAMAFLESAVVIYLRKLYYPEGFSFPLNPIDSLIGITEILREAATLIMLISIAILVGKSRVERFAYFIFGFGVWDIFYYVFLKAIISWPESLLTWDILFLIPFTWTGPVITPIINSLTMIIISLILVYFKNKNIKLVSFKFFIYLLIIGSLFILAAYLEEYLQYMRQEFSIFQMMSINDKVIKYASEFIPQSFNWFLFLSGVTIQVFGTGIFIRKNLKPIN